MSLPKVVSYLLYPRVFPELAAHQAKWSSDRERAAYANAGVLLWHVADATRSTSIDIEKGKTLIVVLTVGGTRERARGRVLARRS